MSTTLVDRVAGLLDRRSSRRGFLSRVAVVGSAVAVGPTSFLLRPGTAYAAVCGIDATCASGYTVFCATLQDGTNACPPGSLVGGWWKSDNSGFCCGAARYYIDCHSVCACGCGRGSNFCGEGCMNCSCGCGPSGQCDQRKVCCNEFRYGQCQQDVACTGPVWCRVVTCTPPWRVEAWKCTTTSATDQRTDRHGSPSLEPCTPINNKFTALGGQGGFLGEAQSGEVSAGPGRATIYQGGTIWWSAQTGAWEVHGAVLEEYKGVGAQDSPLGLPTSDQNRTSDGAGVFNTFARGAIYSHPVHGTHALWGGVHDAWAGERAEQGRLGYPTSDLTPSRDGVARLATFVGGLVTSHPQHGTAVLVGPVLDRWTALGRDTGVLGHPLTSTAESAAGRGRYSHFTGTPDYPGASLYWSAETGARFVRGAVRQAWLDRGGSSGPLGFPIGDPFRAELRSAANGSDFEGGRIVHDPSTGAVTVTPR